MNGMMASYIKTDVPAMEYEAVFPSIFETLLDTEKGVLQNLNDIIAVGHRVVHGGEPLC